MSKSQNLFAKGVREMFTSAHIVCPHIKENKQICECSISADLTKSEKVVKERVLDMPSLNHSIAASARLPQTMSAGASSPRIRRAGAGAGGGVVPSSHFASVDHTPPTLVVVSLNHASSKAALNAFASAANSPM